jgi:hypothetical protein
VSGTAGQDQPRVPVCERHAVDDRGPCPSRSPACRAVLALLLAPVLAAGLWVEAIFGSNVVYGIVTDPPGLRTYGLGALGLVLAAAGPAAVVAATIRTRSRLPGVTSRILRIEIWGITVALSLEFAFLFIGFYVQGGFI